MKYQQMQGRCQNCGEVIINQRIPNNLLHLLLTIGTWGVWLIVWIALLIKHEPWHCTKCSRVVLN